MRYYRSSIFNKENTKKDTLSFSSSSIYIYIYICRYNNGPLDVISTSDRRRDSFGNWLRYLPRFTLYALNISTLRQFFYEGEYKVVFKMMAGKTTSLSIS